MSFPEAEFRESVAPVLLEFGTTVWHCQMFEDNLCFLLALVSEHETPSDGKAFLASWDNNMKKTLGNLVGALVRLIDVPNDLEEFLWVAVVKRNAIVHGYMTRNTMKLFQPKGRLEMIDELKYLRGDVDSRDHAIEQLILALLTKYGVRSHALRAAAERNWRYANLEPPAGDTTGRH